MGNPRFLLVLAIEEVIGCTAKTIAEYQARGKDFWKVDTPSMCFQMHTEYFRILNQNPLLKLPSIHTSHGSFLGQEQAIADNFKMVRKVAGDLQENELR